LEAVDVAVVGEASHARHLQGTSVEPSFTRALRGLIAMRSDAELDAVEPLVLFEPFLEIVRSETTTGLVTDAALNAVMQLLVAGRGILRQDVPESEVVLELVAEAATHCRFESSPGDDGDEVVLSSILNLLKHTLCHPIGTRLEDETVFGMVQTCVRLSLQPRFSTLLRRHAETTATEMLGVVFRRALPLCQPLVVAREELAPAQNLKDDEILDRMLSQVTDSERSEVERDVTGMLNSQRVQFAKEGNTVKKMLQSELSVSCKLFKLVVSLLDRSRPVTNDASVLLGFSVIQALLLEFGGSLERVPGLLAIVQDDLAHNLLQNLVTDNFLVLSGALSVTRNLFVTLTKHIKLQMELIINKLMEWIMVEVAPYQKQEITLEFLVDVLRVPNFVSQLYINYDCDPNCSDLFEKIAVFLYKNSYPADGSLYSTHILTLDGLLCIARGIVDHARADKARKQLPAGDESGIDEEAAPEVDATLVRRRKVIKRHLIQGAKEFNEKRKDDRFVYLQQCGLLPTPVTPRALARFFRTTPQLDKTLVGEVLGGNKEFELQVLEEYLRTFRMESDFLGVLRTFLESFKIPGEAQIIQRVLERFSHHFYEAHKHEGVFASEDAVFLLAYAMLILHVDNHSDKIVNKMREAQFKKTLRGTNGSSDFPEDMLSRIYYSVSTAEIKIYEEYFEGPVTPLRWRGLQKRAKRFANFSLETRGVCDRDVFTLMWGRIVAAIGVVFSNSYNSELLAKTAEGFRLVAEIAAQFGMSDVFDNLIVTLCKHSHVLASRSRSARVNPVVAFGASEKAQTAAALAFSFTREYGNHLREGWRNVVDAILNLHALRLLQVPQLFVLPEFLEPPEVAVAASTAKSVRGNSGIFSLFGASSWFGSGSQSDGEVRRSPTPPPQSSSSSSAPSLIGGQSWNAQEQEMFRAASECIAKCRVDEIVAASAKLQHDALVYLVRALILGSVRSHAVDELSDAPSPGDELFSEEASQLCLDLLTQITLLNEHRIVMIWVLVYEHMTDIIASEASPKALVQRTIGNLLLLCVSFFRHREITDQLIKCVQYMLRLAEKMRTPLVCYKFSAAILRMLVVNPGALLSAAHWGTTMAALRFAVLSPEGAANVVLSAKLVLHFCGMDRDNMMEIGKAAALNGLTLPPRDAPGVQREPLTYAQWRDVLGLLEALSKQDQEAAVSGTVLVDLVGALDVLYLSSPALVEAKAPEEGEQGMERSERHWRHGWQPVLSLLCDLCCHRQSLVRHAAITALQCLLLSNQMSQCSPPLWRICFKTILLPMLEHLASLTGRKAAAVDPMHLEQTRMRAFAVVHKIFLIYLPLLAKLDDFADLWGNMLDCNERYLLIPENALLAEMVVESLKNLLLVLYDCRLLEEGKPLAVYTWDRVSRFRLDLNLREEVLREATPTVTPPPAPSTPGK
jgi:brefeldin A-resistance guanine nucleotide exchange factor 1